MYVIRKCFELGLDLRKIFARNDENEINALSRFKFTRILQNLPLGLDDAEIREIF